MTLLPSPTVSPVIVDQSANDVLAVASAAISAIRLKLFLICFAAPLRWSSRFYLTALRKPGSSFSSNLCRFKRQLRHRGRIQRAAFWRIENKTAEQIARLNRAYIADRRLQSQLDREPPTTA